MFQNLCFKKYTQTYKRLNFKKTLNIISYNLVHIVHTLNYVVEMSIIELIAPLTNWFCNRSVKDEHEKWPYIIAKTYFLQTNTVL